MGFALARHFGLCNSPIDNTIQPECLNALQTGFTVQTYAATSPTPPHPLTGVKVVKTNEDVKMQLDNYLQVQRKRLVLMMNLSIGFFDSLST